MTDQQHAAAEPPAGSGAPPPGTGTGGEPRAHGDAGGPGAPHKFRRDRRQRMLGGVCAGLGRQCDMDPVIFRIVLAVLSATGGIGAASCVREPSSRVM